MADLPQPDDYPAGIYQLEELDPVQGGPGGIDNLQATQLASRTQYLRLRLDPLLPSPGAYPSLPARLDPLIRTRVHGTDAAADRPPGASPVLWIGSAIPTNAELHDLHARTPTP